MIEVKSPVITNKDINIVLSGICGLLINIILFLVDFWQCDTIPQIVIIIVVVSIFFGKAIYFISDKAMKIANWRY